MKISIITVVYNNEKEIEDTIKSVLNQTYKNIEYIIIDGSSTDNTRNIIKKYIKKISIFISEPDNGLYYAMNKGIRIATGDVIGFINSDDFYFSSSVIEKIADEFISKKIDCLYGDIVYVESKNSSKIIRYWKSKKYEKGLFKKGWHPAHPSFFVKKHIYDKYGVFNTNFTIAADYELMLRFLEKNNILSSYLPEVLVKMRSGGQSNKNILKIIKANIESYKAWKTNFLYINPIIFLKKPISKIFQYFKIKNLKQV